MAAQVTETMHRPLADLARTTREASAQAIAAERARDAFYASHSRELRCALDADARFVSLEGAWEPVLGWDPKELVGWELEEIVHPPDRPRVAKTLARLRAARGCEREFEMRLAMPSGGHRLISWTFIAGTGSECYLGLGHDRTSESAEGSRDRRAVARLERRNEELALRVEALEELTAAVERFAGTAAHQLAEPLVIAESSAILIADELGPDLDPLLRDRLDAIGRGAARARRLMDALLADARSAAQPLELRNVELAPVVDETLASLGTQIDEYGSRVVVGPMPCVRGEAGLLAVILENLLSNALKYGPRQEGRINVFADRRPDGWRLSVSGGGTPLARADAERIFEPFHRAHGERRVPGVGLGLTICTRLVDRLGGTMGVEPGTETGNTFWVELPAAA